MHGPEHLIGLGRQDGAGVDDLSAGSFPAIPETREAEGALILHTEEEGLLFTIRSLPLVKTIRGDDAASLIECIAKRRLLLNSLAAGVDEPSAHRLILRP